MKRIPIGHMKYQYMYVDKEDVVALVYDLGVVCNRQMWAVNFIGLKMMDE